MWVWCANRSEAPELKCEKVSWLLTFEPSRRIAAKRTGGKVYIVGVRTKQEAGVKFVLV